VIAAARGLAGRQLRQAHEGEQAPALPGVGEPRRQPLAPGAAEGGGALGLGQQGRHRRRHRGDVPLVDEHPRRAGGDRLGDAAVPGRDDRQRRGHRLENADRQPLDIVVVGGDRMLHEQRRPRE
jgi:hypothetical protein